MLNELKTYLKTAKEAEHEIFYAVTSAEYTDWDRGSGNLSDAIRMLEEASGEEGAEIAIIDVDGSFCIDVMTLDEAEDELNRIG